MIHQIKENVLAHLLDIVILKLGIKVKNCIRKPDFCSLTNRGNCPRGNCPTGVMVLGGSCPGG